MAEGLTAAGLARLHAAAGQHVGDEDLPGLVALVAQVAHGGQVHVEALGRLAIEGGPPPQAHRDIQVAAYSALG
jgi:hypothetical protein